jgi:cbb3-type cytochrome oxidase maturation protein
MKIMFFLIVLSLIVALGFLAAFLWATKTGQFDDEYTPSVRMLFDNIGISNNEQGISNVEGNNDTDVKISKR